MVTLWILLGIIALFWILLATPVRIFLSYRDYELIYQLKYGPFRLIDSQKPAKEKQPKPKTPQESTTTKKPRKKSGGLVGKLLDFLGLSEISSITNLKKSISVKGITGTISAIFSALKELFARIGKLIKKGVFRKFHLSIIVADEDAADAALQFGQVCAISFPMLEYLESTIKIQNKNIDIRCDYDLEETQVTFNGQLNYRPWHFVCFFMGLVWNYIKRSIRRK